jgi:hypothetical protein
LTYGGRRQAGLGKRNDVVKLTFEDGFAVEFEFSDDGLPMKALFTRLNADKEEIKEEDRYAQFVDVQGIKTPFIYRPLFKQTANQPYQFRISRV